MVSKDPNSIIPLNKSNDDALQKIKSMSKENKIFLIEEMNIASEDIKGRITDIKKPSIKDFNILALLGKGAYAKVVLALNIYNGKEYAIKIIDKHFIDIQHKQYEVHIERYVLKTLSHPNIIKMNLAFQDRRKLYFVLEYCNNKDLATLSRNIGKFPLSIGKYYAAEILSALEYMHSKGVYHRDLKAENIALDNDYHVKIIDFGTANILNQYFDLKTMKFIQITDEDMKRKLNENTVNTGNDNDINIQIGNYTIHNLLKEFVGSTNYVSPEVLNNDYNNISPSVDLWAYGVLLYLIFQGRFPFNGITKEETFDKIVQCKYSFDDDIDSDVKDLICKILVINPKDRIGFGDYGYRDIKAHPLFKDIDFINLCTTAVPKELHSLLSTYYKFEVPQKIYKDSSNNLNQTKHFLSGGRFELRNELIANEATQIIDNPLIAKPRYILLDNILQKKSPWLHYNTRIVRLYSDGYAEYFEPKTNKVKGSFNLNEQCVAVLIDDFRFNLITSKREYVFKNVKERLAGLWVEKINILITAMKKKRKMSHIKNI